MTNRNQIDQEIEKLKNAIVELEKTRSILEKLTVDQRIADYMHEHLCHWNHTDGCSWEYESWEKPGTARREWIRKAQLVYGAIETYISDIMYESGVDTHDIPKAIEHQEKQIEDVIYQIVRGLE